MAAPHALDGVFAINKPLGMSSAQVIRDCQHYFNPSDLFKPMIDQEKANKGRESNSKRKRRGFGKNDIRVKMGHGGTLDPLATGVLILGVGKGTKSLQSFLDCTKTYETVVLFGASTDTYDRVGKVLKKTAYDHITRPMVEEAMKSFRGKYQQMPPLYSALKMEGKPLYEYAREGKPIPREIATREVDVSELELVEWYEPGTHNHRWPTEDATKFERDFAENVWKVEKQQLASKKLTPEEEEEESKALQALENFKKKADENVDALVYDKLNKRRKHAQPQPAMMSGALGDLPPADPRPGKGSNLIPAAPDPNTPPPWDDKGPPAARIRMTVTSGFYVRSFCHDLGTKIGSAAMMAELCRSRQGDFVLGSSNCLEYSDITKGEAVWAPQVQSMLTEWNSKGSPGVPESPLRAKQNPPSQPFRKSVESPSPTKRKALDDSETETPATKTNVPPSSKNRSSRSPKSPPASKPVEGEETTDAPVGPSQSEQDVASKAPSKPGSQGTEDEWNGFSDNPAAGKPESGVAPTA